MKSSDEQVTRWLKDIQNREMTEEEARIFPPGGSVDKSKIGVDPVYMALLEAQLYLIINDTKNPRIGVFGVFPRFSLNNTDRFNEVMRLLEMAKKKGAIGDGVFSDFAEMYFATPVVREKLARRFIRKYS